MQMARSVFLNTAYRRISVTVFKCSCNFQQVPQQQEIAHSLEAASVDVSGPSSSQQTVTGRVFKIHYCFYP